MNSEKKHTHTLSNSMFRCVQTKKVNVCVCVCVCVCGRLEAMFTLLDSLVRSKPEWVKQFGAPRCAKDIINLERRKGEEEEEEEEGPGVGGGTRCMREEEEKIGEEE